MSKEILKLSPDAVGAIMLAVQAGAMAVIRSRPREEQDVTGMMLGFELENTPKGLVVLNPPTINFGEDDEDVDVEIEDLTEE